ncbi:MAG: Mu transposase C-terminal domain-containing protein [Balneola sp.]
MIQEFYQIEELANKLSLSRRAVQKWIDSNKIQDQYLRKEVFRGREGYKQLISPMGIPEPHRSTYIRKYFKRDSDQISQAIDAEIYMKAPKYAKEHVDMWINLIKQFGHLKGKELKCAIKAYKQANPNDKVSWQSFYRNKKLYDDQGIAGLIPNYGNRKGCSKTEDENYKLFEALYLKESRPSATSCWSIVRGEAYKKGQDVKDFPDYRTFLYRLERENTESHIYFCRYGEEAWNKKYADYVDRDKSAIAAGSCWVGDHRQLDIFCKNPETGNIFRPWATAWFDFKSNKWMSVYLHEDAPNSDHIFQSFKWAIEKYGRPNSIYIDNGKDYRSLDFAGGRKNIKVEVEEASARSLVNFMGIEAFFSLPYNAQSKNIERGFKEFINNYETHLDGYTGSGPKTRPADTNSMLKKGEALDFPTFEKLFEGFVFNVMNKKASEGKELQGKSPDELFYAEHTKIAVRPEALRMLCMRTSRPVTIRRNGVKDGQLKKHYYAEWMVGFKGVKVYMRRDPKAYQEAWVFHAETDEFLGTAQMSERIAGLADTDIEKQKLKDLQARKARELKLNRQAREARREHYLDAEETLEALEANIEVETEIRKASGDFWDYNESSPVIEMDTNKMDEVIRQDEKMKRTGTEDLSAFEPAETKKSLLKTIWDD